HVQLPVRAGAAEGSAQAQADAAVRFDPPVRITPLDVEYPEQGRAGASRPERLISHDVVAKETFTQVDPAYGGTRVYPDGLHYDEDAVERYWIRQDDPLSARVESVWTMRLARPDMGWSTEIEARTEISCDAESFHTRSAIRCSSGEDLVAEKEWTRSIPRTAG